MDRSIAAPRPKLICIFRRLEAATSRLEDMATSIDSTHPSTVAAISSSAVAPESGTTGTPAEGPSAEKLPPTIADFDKVINGEVKTFVAASEKLGGLVEQQAWAELSSTSNIV
jgi:adenylyl cyclase-associated protein